MCKTDHVGFHKNENRMNAYIKTSIAYYLLDSRLFTENLIRIIHATNNSKLGTGGIRFILSPTFFFKHCGMITVSAPLVK